MPLKMHQYICLYLLLLLLHPIHSAWRLFLVFFFFLLFQVLCPGDQDNNSNFFFYLCLSILSFDSSVFLFLWLRLIRLNFLSFLSLLLNDHYVHPSNSADRKGECIPYFKPYVVFSLHMKLVLKTRSALSLSEREFFLETSKKKFSYSSYKLTQVTPGDFFLFSENFFSPTSFQEKEKKLFFSPKTLRLFLLPLLS